MQHKRNKKQLEIILPSGLYVNSKLGKRGKGELKSSLNVRIAKKQFIDMMEKLNSLNISQSNFIRYAIKLGLDDIDNKLESSEIVKPIILPND
jgi:hypothetical protein